VYAAVRAALDGGRTEPGTFAHRFRATTGVQDASGLLQQFEAQLATCTAACALAF
jgi:hypothetical protein